MKRAYFLILFAHLFLRLAAQQALDTSSLPPFSDSTALGKPDGQVSAKRIGPAGGTIVSADKKLELIFPPGALVTDLDISIQPVTNPIENGSGKAYQFEPSGTRFRKPVQLIFHYTEEEAQTCPPELMGLAMQDQNGKWSLTEYEDWDSLSKTLKGWIHHFSTFSDVKNIWIKCETTELPVNGEAIVAVYDISNLIRTEGGARDYAFANISKNGAWLVNGVKNGNAQTGIFSPWNLVGRKTTNYAGIYTAPNILPKRNPVQIELSFPYQSKKTKKTAWGSCRCVISIYDVYRIKVENEYTGRAEMESQLIDSASFTVWVYPTKFLIKDISNYEPIILKQGKKDRFREKLSVDGALGTVHITEGIKNDSLSHDYPPEVYFEFTPVTVTIFRAQYSGGPATSAITPIMEKSIPEEINFIANGQPQRYNITTPKRSYKLIVTPVRTPRKGSQ